MGLDAVTTLILFREHALHELHLLCALFFHELVLLFKLECVFDVQFAVWGVFLLVHLLANVLHVRLKTRSDFFFAILLFFCDLCVLAREVFVLLVVFPRNDFILLLNQVRLLVTHQLLLCLEIGQLLVELALKRLHN